MSKPSSRASSIPITLLRHKEFKEWLKAQRQPIASWVAANHFTAKPGTHCLLADAKGNIGGVIIGVNDPIDPWALGDCPTTLPPGAYHLETRVDAKTADALVLGWLLGSYQFTRYKKEEKKLAVLTPPKGCDTKNITAMADAIYQARDLINTPANDMGPAELAAACKQVAKSFDAEYSEIIGENLIKANYPAIYEVGKASTRAPRLIDIRWGDKRHPKITLVGKGVCFDSGGLDIKPSSGMRMMKKDMGGAACVLALARVLMAAKLKIRLRVLIPAVENSIAGNAYRPLDVIRTRKGLSVEIGNTDAEGRIILCDALYEADLEKPELLIDCATLTGAARTALGTDVAALFTPDDTLADHLMSHSVKQDDPLWRLPLREGYRAMLNSPVADINSAPDSGYAGAITAALYLKEFVTQTKSWVHIDMMAWNLKSRPGRPVGGEAMAVRALFAYIKEQFHA
jgi:leucyl aminopeptidase